MVTTKVAITIDTELIAQVDSLVSQKVFPSRSKAIQSAIENQLIQLWHDRLARELENLDLSEEQKIADEGIFEELLLCPKY